MSTYNFSSVDPEHYNRIRATIPNHFLTRTVNICVSTLTTNCNIEVMNEQDYIEFEIWYDHNITINKVFMKPHSNISVSSISDILNDIFEEKELKIKVSITDLNTIKFVSDYRFSILDMSYNMKLICGFYCLDDSKWPIKGTETIVQEPYPEIEEKPLTNIEYKGMDVRCGTYQMINQVLTPKDAYGFTCQYTIDKEEICSIDENGYVYGMKSGTANIMYKVWNPGSSEYSVADFTGSFLVQVFTPYHDEVISVSVPEKLDLKVHDEIHVYPSIFPAHANYKEEWKSTKPDIVAVNNGYVRALKKGASTITYTLTNEYPNPDKKPAEGEPVPLIKQEFFKFIIVEVKSDVDVKKFVIQSDTVGYYLSTPILYLLTNVGNHVFFNEMHNSKRLQCGTVCMCLNNSFSSSFPIIASQGEIITRCSIGLASDIWFILVDANMKEVKLLNPMYITVSVRPDESDPATTPGLL